MHRTQSLRITALAAALSAIYPLQAFANAGVAQFAVGDVAVQRASGSSSLASGARLESGDTVTTGNTGRTQLRFTDGGMVSLQPNSQFKLTRYSDSAAGTGQDSFLVDLARGGMRAITGLIGKRSRDTYKVTTTTATIGIRGSGFSMAYNADGTLGVTTELDAIEVCTQAGCVGLNVGESVVVTDASSLPRRTFVRASWNAPNPNRKITARNDDVDAEGKTVTLQVDTGLAFTAAGLTEGDPDNRLYLRGALVSEDGTGKVLGYLSRNNERGSGGTVEAQHEQGTLAGGDQMILGTWTSPVWSDTSASINKAGFVAGVPTPEAGLRSMVDLRGRYDLYLGTPVYSSSGNMGELLTSSHLLVDFRSAFAAIDANLHVRMPNPMEVSSGQSLPEDGSIYYNMIGTANAVNSGFAGKLAVYASPYGLEQNTEYYYGSGYQGTGQFQGFFGGGTAGNVGLSYSAPTDTYGNLAGAGIFYKNAEGSGVLPTKALNQYDSDFTSMELHLLDGSGVLTASVAEGGGMMIPAVVETPYYEQGNNVFRANSSCSSSTAGQAVFSGAQLRSWDSGVSYYEPQQKAEATSGASGSSVQSYGSVGQPGSNDFLGWGSWKQANVQRGDINSGNVQALTDVHYLVGTPVTPYGYKYMEGTVNYNFIGGSNPTATVNGVTQMGSILPSSNLAVNFANSTINATIGVKFGDTSVSLQGSGLVDYSQIRSTGGALSFSGFFTGSEGERAGIVYGATHQSLVNIRGAAAFQTSTRPDNRD